MADYIKREDVYVAIQNLYPGIPMVKPLIKKWHENNKAYMECETAIARVPAADVRPVVHARWKFNKLHNGFNCSECGRFERNREPFCNCGADMREEVADNG